MKSAHIDTVEDAEFLRVMFDPNASKEAVYTTLAAFHRYIGPGEYNGDYSWTFEHCSSDTFMDALYDTIDYDGFNPLESAVKGIDWVTDDNEAYQWGEYLRLSKEAFGDQEEPAIDGILKLRELKLI